MRRQYLSIVIGIVSILFCSCSGFYHEVLNEPPNADIEPEWSYWVPGSPDYISTGVDMIKVSRSDYKAATHLYDTLQKRTSVIIEKDVHPTIDLTKSSVYDLKMEEVVKYQLGLFERKRSRYDLFRTTSRQILYESYEKGSLLGYAGADRALLVRNGDTIFHQFMLPEYDKFAFDSTGIYLYYDQRAMGQEGIRLNHYSWNSIISPNHTTPYPRALAALTSYALLPLDLVLYTLLFILVLPIMILGGGSC